MKCIVVEYVTLVFLSSRVMAHRKLPPCWLETCPIRVTNSYQNWGSLILQSTTVHVCWARIPIQCTWQDTPVIIRSPDKTWYNQKTSVYHLQTPDSHANIFIRCWQWEIWPKKVFTIYMDVQLTIKKSWKFKLQIEIKPAIFSLPNRRSSMVVRSPCDQST